jgi:hypothetical protein
MTSQPQVGAGDDGGPFFELLNGEEWHHERFNTHGFTYSVRVGGITRDMRFDEIVISIGEILTNLLDNLLNGVPDRDLVRISINGQGLREITLPFMRRDQVSVEKILDEIEKICQSNDSWLFAGYFFITFDRVVMPVGGSD